MLSDKSPDDFDAWYACEFEAEAPCFQAFSRNVLRFDGLATIADVWLNGDHTLRSENMFLRHELDVTESLRRGSNTIAIRFASLNRFLEGRQPRPRWRTHLVDDAKLRGIRTTLLGRMPGWHHHAQRIHGVGPWRPVALVTERLVRLEASNFNVSNDSNVRGIVEAKLSLRSLTGDPIRNAILAVGDAASALDIQDAGGGLFLLTGKVALDSIALWWPHTHGDHALYPVRVSIGIGSAGDPPVEVDFGVTGFRSVGLDTADGAFALSVNAVGVFFRGACWTSIDPLNVAGGPTAYNRPLDLACAAGMNMIRVPGYAFYEADAFYDGCAEKGIAIWQDYAFALMDYPTGDSEFTDSVRAEVNQFLDRIQLNPAIAMLCGNSECAATAALNGLAPDEWANPLLDDMLPVISRELRPDVPFVPSSEWGGALPFHVDTGVSNYYGVGAYLRPLDDARRSRLRFAAECLAFANIPEDESIDIFLANRESPGNDPSWKAAVPRNVSLGWDFDDVRDHYVRTLLGEDPSSSRFSDSERYLALGRVAVGEAMLAAFAEWRRAGSACRGALVLCFQDLWPGAGWGCLDSFGRPKSVYYYLKRALCPIAVFFSDEGMSGLRVHVVNETREPVKADLRISLYRHGQTLVHEERLAVNVAARSASEWSVDGILGRFVDTSYSYKFGPPVQDVTVAALERDTGTPPIPKAYFFPTGRQFARLTDSPIEAVATPRHDGGGYDLTVSATRFAQAINIHARGFEPADNYFHVEPERSHTVVLACDLLAPPAHLDGSVGALNCLSRAKIRVEGRSA